MGEKNTTIAAVATVAGKGALAVLRISGPGAFAVCEACIAEKGKFAGRGPWMSGLYTLCDPKSGQIIDRVTAVKYRAPRSYTGEDMVEVTTHGGEVIPGRALGALLAAGAVPAGPGEFTRRAVLAGKMDLLSAEAVNALVCASGEEECRRAQWAGSGGQGRVLAEVESELREIGAELEAGIEFGVAGERTAGDVRGRVSAVRERLGRELERWERVCRGEAATEVVIAGMVNAGKSTLFNLLVGEERTLVDEQAGTTRDNVSETVALGPERVRLVDTAGFGERGGALGVRSEERSWQGVERAAGVVWVCPMDIPALTAEERMLADRAGGRMVCVVLSKRDREVAGERLSVAEGLGVTTVGGNLMSGQDRVHVREVVCGEIRRLAAKVGEQTLVLNERQAAVVRGVCRTLDDAVCGESAQDDATVAECVARALGELGALGGGRLDLLDTVFSRFCVGK